jgi:16S rRNA G966 N2-methylase RsmD
MDTQSVKVLSSNEVGKAIGWGEGTVTVEFYAGSCCTRIETLSRDLVDLVGGEPSTVECCAECKA